ncbi:MAG: AlpA family phage regulatory protein [Verrucomicrobiaceae bacterium]
MNNEAPNSAKATRTRRRPEADWAPHLTNDPRRIIREPERRFLTGLSRTQWWRLEQDDKAPRRIMLSQIAHGWTWGEITDWIEARAAARRGRGGSHGK